MREAQIDVNENGEYQGQQVRRSNGELTSRYSRDPLTLFDHQMIPIAATQPSRAAGTVLRLQRLCGNRFVQRAFANQIKDEDQTNAKPESHSIRGMEHSSGAFTTGLVSPPAMIQRDDDNGNDDNAQKSPPLVGQDRAIDPKDNICSLKWTVGGKKWLLPSGVSCDPGVAHIPAHGDPFTYPKDDKDAPPSGGPAMCSDGQPRTPTGSCCPPGQPWDQSSMKCLAPTGQTHLCPPLQTWDGVKCVMPHWEECMNGATVDSAGKLCPPQKATEQPGDYEIPDTSKGTVA